MEFGQPNYPEAGGGGFDFDDQITEHLYVARRIYDLYTTLMFAF